MIGDVTVVVGSVTAATVLSEINQASKGTPTMKPIIGGMVLGAFLLLIAMWSTEIATALAVLVLATSFLVNGGPVFKQIAKVTG